MYVIFLLCELNFWIPEGPCFEMLFFIWNILLNYTHFNNIFEWKWFFTMTSLRVAV